MNAFPYLSGNLNQSIKNQRLEKFQLRAFYKFSYWNKTKSKKHFELYSVKIKVGNKLHGENSNGV